MKNLYLEQVLKQRLIPQPKEISFQDGECLIQDGISVELKMKRNSAKLLQNFFLNTGMFPPKSN